MHANARVHQALGPESLLLSSTEERDAGFLRVRLYDFASAVDVSDAALLGGPTLGDLWDNRGRSSGSISGFRCAPVLMQLSAPCTWSWSSETLVGVALERHAYMHECW
jgi:hypothetical protein